uniref:Phosphoinositide-3-kinase, regulatory subunit 6a n=1 Tax=Eptatretus burgeri TaxID=7764 RepID=A0A8C4PZV4_EPTBU
MGTFVTLDRFVMAVYQYLTPDSNSVPLAKSTIVYNKLLQSHGDSYLIWMEVWPVLRIVLPHAFFLYIPPYAHPLQPPLYLPLPAYSPFCTPILPQMPTAHPFMDPERMSTRSSYGSLAETARGDPDCPGVETHRGVCGPIVCMADSSQTLEDIEGELATIEQLREVLVRHESELRYMKEDIYLCQEIKKLKQDLHQLSALPDKQKCVETQEKEAKLIEMIQKQVEKRDYLVDDMDFERLREYEEDCEMSEFLQKKLKKKERPGKTG